MAVQVMEGGDSLLKKLQEESDLYGASSDSEEERGESPPLDNGGDSRVGREEDEFEEEEEFPSSPLSREVKKSGKSRPKSSKTKGKPSGMAGINRLYSDSQRVLRETPLNLPQHQPEERTIDSFLARVRTRKALRNSRPTSKTSAVAATPTSHLPTQMNLTKPLPENVPPLTQPASKETTLTTPNVSSTKKYSRATLSQMIDSSAPPPRLLTREEFYMEEEGEGLPGARPTKQLVQNQLNKKTPANSQKNGLATMLPEDTVKKLQDKPGALRGEWKKLMKDRLTQYTLDRMQSQKAMERERKKYEEEEFGPEDEEEEDMFSDSSDEEYVADGGVAEEGAADEGSDICSDLEEEEKGEEPAKEEGGDVGSEEEDGYSSDEDVVDVRTTAKRARATKLIDSDESDDEEVGLEEREENKADVILDENSSFPRLRLEITETMMGSESSPVSMDTESNSFPPASQTCYKHNPSHSEAREEADQTLVEVREGDIATNGMEEESSKSLIAIESNGDKTEKTDSLGLKQPERKADVEEKSLATSEDSVMDGDSTEMSFQWGQSLPLAQRPSVRQQDFLPTGTPGDILGEASQWQVTPMEGGTQKLVEDETQILDKEGFIYVREKHSSPGTGLLDTMAIATSGSPGDDDDIANLCSGNFPDTFPGTISRMKPPTTFSQESDSTSSGSDDEDDGQVSSSYFQDSVSRRAQTKSGGCVEESSSKESAGSSTGGGMEKLEGSLSGGRVKKDEEEGPGGDTDNAVWRWAQRHQPPAGSDGGGAEQAHELGGSKLGGHGFLSDEEKEEEELDSDMPTIHRRKVIVRQSKAERLAEYVESEAELSGEDVGPDEEEEEEDEEDMLNQYLQDEAELGLSKEELWDQVAKAHLKHTTSDDKAEISELKERFLKDGDLFEDGLALKNGFFRTRHFAQGSEAGSLELFSEDRDSGEEEGGVARNDDMAGQDAAKIRRDRLEREEFIRKCRENENSVLDDNNSRSILSLINDTTSMTSFTTPKDKPRQFKPCNSFLKRSVSTPSSLQRSNSSSSSSCVATPTNVGTMARRGFVFHKSTPVTKKNSDSPPDTGKKRPPKANHHQSLPPKKKPRFKTSFTTPSSKSIFKSLYQSQ